MKTDEEKKKDALDALKEILMDPAHAGSLVIRKGDGLDEEQIESLTRLGCLREPADGWYVVCHNEDGDDPSNWYWSYWQFITAFLDDLYDGKWCLSPECSLDFHGADSRVPTDLIIRSMDAPGTVLTLPFDTHLIQVRGRIPEETEKEPRYWVRLCPLHLALLTASQDYIDSHPLEVRTCIAMIAAPAALIDTALEEWRPERARFIASELRAIGRSQAADEIETAVAEYGKGAERFFYPQEGRPSRLEEIGAVGNRIRLLWRDLRPKVLALKLAGDCERNPKSVREVILDLGRVASKEEFKCLGMAGFDAELFMLPDAVDTDRTGDGKPDVKRMMEEITEDIKTDRMKALGYRCAFNDVRADILDALTGGSRPGNLTALHFRDWNYALFRPGIKEGVFKSEDHFSERMLPAGSLVEGSRHIPVDPDDMDEALDALDNMIQREDDDFVRAVLGHFFLIYIQPFTAGNLQTAWLLMNCQLVAGGYPWISYDDPIREKYMETMREALDGGQITAFTQLVTSLIRSEQRMESIRTRREKRA